MGFYGPREHRAARQIQTAFRRRVLPRRVLPRPLSTQLRFTIPPRSPRPAAAEPMPVDATAEAPAALAPRRAASSSGHHTTHHTKARSELNAEYVGRRLNVPEALVPWSQPWRGYEPAYFDADIVIANGRDQPEGDRWADPQTPLEMRSELDARTTYSVGGFTSRLADAVAFDEWSGAPLNPRGRTGLVRLLGKWGPTTRPIRS